MTLRVRRHSRLLLGLACAGIFAFGALAVAKDKQGSPGADRIDGTVGPDRLGGGAGDDSLNGLAGPDTLKGGRGDDALRGGRGGDRLVGGKHGDRLIGGAGRDEINMRNGVEIHSPGNDFINARDGTPDQINCGDGGRDVVKVDAVEEGVYDCEIIRDPKVKGENID